MFKRERERDSARGRELERERGFPRLGMLASNISCS